MFIILSVQIPCSSFSRIADFQERTRVIPPPYELTAKDVIYSLEKGGYYNFKQHPVGTGPFMFSSYTAGDKLILTANKNYFRGKPLLKGVEIHFIPDNKRRETAYKKGLVDMIFGVGDPGWIEKINNHPDTIVDVFGPGVTGLFHFNTSINPIVLYFTFRPNADAYLRGFFHSDSIVTTGIKPHTNFSHYTKIDKLLDDALKTISPKRQIHLWEQAQIKILHDAMVYPLFNINQCTVRKDTVDYGHPLISTLAGYPLFSEKTRIITTR